MQKKVSVFTLFRKKILMEILKKQCDVN
jgi:hypothetical protein